MQFKDWVYLISVMEEFWLVQDPQSDEGDMMVEKSLFTVERHALDYNKARVV